MRVYEALPLIGDTTGVVKIRYEEEDSPALMIAFM